MEKTPDQSASPARVNDVTFFKEKFSVREINQRVNSANKNPKRIAIEEQTCRGRTKMD